MRTYALLANVVRTQNAALQGWVEVETTVNESGSLGPSTALNLTRKVADRTLDLSFHYERDVDIDGSGYRNRFAADGTALRLARYEDPEIRNVLQATAQYRRTLIGEQLGLGAVIARDTDHNVRDEHVSFPAPLLLSVRQRERKSSVELQMQHERDCSDANALQLFAIHRTVAARESDCEASASQTERLRQFREFGQ